MNTTTNTTKPKIETKYIVLWYENGEVFNFKKEAMEFITEELIKNAGVPDDDIQVFVGNKLQLKITITLEE